MAEIEIGPNLYLILSTVVTGLVGYLVGRKQGYKKGCTKTKNGTA